MDPLIICDCNYLCYRVSFKLNLSTKEYTDAEQWQLKQVGVIFGFMKTILTIATDLNSNNFVFCWDSKESHRVKDNKTYKETRRDIERTPDEWEQRQMIFDQFDELREEILPNLGFKNVFMQEGYEADDLIAWIAKNKNDLSKVVVSTDTDLYQILDTIKGLYNPIKRALYTEGDLRFDYSVFPSQWATVKAIAGDKTDNVIGIKGIGLRTASKFVTDRMGVSVRQRMLIDAELDKIANNLKAVTLPYPGVAPMSIKPSRFNFDAFEEICTKLEFHSFLNKSELVKWRRAFA